MRSRQILPALVVFATATCYLPNKLETGDSFIPCGVNGFSSCCVEGETCLENGLCQEASGKWYSGPCDNPDWDGCYQACVEPFLSHGYVEQCTSEKYCCLGYEDDISCCGKTSAEYFSATLSSSSKSTVSVTESPSSKSTIYVTASPSSNPTVYVTASPDPVKPLPAGIIAGIAMGAVVVVGSIGAIIWVLLRRIWSTLDAGNQGDLMQMQQPQVGSPMGPPNTDTAGVTGMGIGEGTGLGVAAVGVNAGENRESYMTEIHGGHEMPVEIDDGVRMQPPVEMEAQVTTALMQPHSQSAVRKDVFEV